MIKEKYNQWRLSYQIGRIRTIGYIHKLWARRKKETENERNFVSK